MIRVAGIGDVVMASALLARIRAEQPNAHVTWACGSVSAPLVRMLDGVDEVISFDEHRLMRGSGVARGTEMLAVWRQLLGRGYTRVFLLHVDARYRALIAPLLGVPVTTLSRAEHGAMNPVPGRYFGDEYARLLDGRGHVGPIEGHWPLATVSHLPAGERRTKKLIALIPGGAKNVLRESALKRWPAESYALVARQLVAEGHEVALFGNGDDAWVREYFNGAGVTDRIGALSLPETAAALAGADVVVTHDTGPMHIARLVRAPLVAIFGPTQPQHFIVADERTIVHWGGEHLACRPCYDGREFAACSNNLCVKSVSVDQVLTSVRSLLARTTTTPAPRDRETLGENVLR